MATKKPKSLKYKVVLSYLLLFCIAVVSVWFVYTEILKIAMPDQNTNKDNKTIIQISNAIAHLYASEAVGRSSILTGSASDYENYNQLIDSIYNEIEIIKSDAEESQLPKFDSIQLLLNRKRNSITEIVQYRRNFSLQNTFKKAINRIYTTKDSLVSNSEPIKSTKRNQWQDFINAALTPTQLDSLSRLPISNDSLIMAFDKILTDLVIKENKLNYELYQKEQKLLEENRIISDQLRVILASVEKEILQKSYVKIQESEKAISKTTETIAWAGAITLGLLIIFTWIIIRDLTTNQNYRKQLEILNQQNEDLLRSKTMLLATVTHDLQTPLGSIIGFSDLMKNTAINQKQQQYLDNIKHSSNYIISLVNDLIDFSKLENNRIKIDKVSFNVKELIETTCETLAQNAADKNIELNWKIEESLNSNFISDPYRIKQVLTNLITNAIKFTKEGSVEVTGKIETENIIIKVTDTGIGIAKNKQEDVFKEFTQAHPGIEKKFGGTGLGLTIAKKMLELLDGSITLESEEGKGSVFTLKIPCIKGKTVQPVIQSIPPEDSFLENKKILIIDDDKMQLALMKEVFSAYPAKITTEIDASLVISILEKEEYDIVLTDIQMPGTDGFELIKLIRNHTDPKIANLPVIALSGKRDLDDNHFVSKGFTAKHTKPMQLEKLLYVIRNIFSGNQLNLLPGEENNKQTNTALYNLRSLSQFTYNDQKALNNILQTFFSSTNENCQDLLKAADNNDDKELSLIAHKMIPMLKQIEANSIVELLEPLEDRKIKLKDGELKKHINSICGSVAKLIEKLKEEIK